LLSSFIWRIVREVGLSKALKRGQVLAKGKDKQKKQREKETFENAFRKAKGKERQERW